MKIVSGDIIFMKGGKPAIVTSKNESNGKIKTDANLEKVQNLSSTGIINGLKPSQKAAYHTELNTVDQPDKKKEIDDLHQRIGELKKEKADPRIVKYLENDLQFRMLKERHTPASYEMDIRTLTSY